MTTLQEERFHNEFSERPSLDEAIGWINNNLDIGDVFDNDKIVKYVTYKMQPDDWFDIDDLGAWAEANGYVKDSNSL